MAIAACGVLSAIVVGNSNLPSKVRNRLRRFLRTLRKPAADDEIIAALKSKFDFMKFEEDSVEKFVRAYKTSYSASVILPLDEGISKLLLLSTDFIQNRGDESRILRFVALYSPYDTPCYNPYRWVNRDADV